MDTVVHRHGHVIGQILLTEYIVLFSLQQHTTVQQLFTLNLVHHQPGVQLRRSQITEEALSKAH